MAIIHEDGTGKSDAESYSSVATADTYWTAHGSPSAWTGASTATKEGALRFATRWLDGYYAWRGSIKVQTQALGWPRVGAVDNEGRLFADNAVPTLLTEATCQLARDHISQSLDAPSRAPVESVSIPGPISVDFADPWSPGLWRYVERLLSDLVAGLKPSLLAQPVLLRA